jgi:hypothetical protein
MSSSLDKKKGYVLRATRGRRGGHSAPGRSWKRVSCPAAIQNGQRYPTTSKCRELQERRQSLSQGLFLPPMDSALGAEKA